MKITPVKTRIFTSGESLVDFILEQTKCPSENSILLITSKIASLAENKLVKKNSISKLDLIKKEADVYLGEIMEGVSLTIKEGLFIPSAGIDESNADGDFYILYPDHPQELVISLHEKLKQAWRVKNLGVILTDSHTHPLRRGVTGIALASHGFEPVHDLVGEKDLFGKPFKYSAVNVVDSLATAGCLLMGEGQERSPLAWIQEAPIRFTDRPESDIRIPMERDLYLPLYQALIEGTKK